MDLTPNNRHRIGLFLTAVTVGLCLTLGLPLRESLGVVVIALALTWALGSDNKALRYFIASAAALCMVGPAIFAVAGHVSEIQRYKENVNTFVSNIPALASSHPDITAGLVPRADIFDQITTVAPELKSLDKAHDPYAKTTIRLTPPPGTTLSPIIEIAKLAPIYVRVPQVGTIQFPPGTSGRDMATSLRKSYSPRVPQWYLEALDGGVDPTTIDSWEAPLTAPSHLDLWNALVEGMFVEIPALLLASLFLSSLFFRMRAN